MTDLLKCLDDVVGMTQETCACLTSGEDCDFATSKSGLYIDEVEGGISLKAVKNLDTCKSLCDMLFKVKTIAERRAGDDLITALSAKYSNKKHAFIGNIGQMNFTGTMGASKQYCGLVVKPHYESADSVLIVKSINLNIDTTAPVTLQVIRAAKQSTYGTVVATLATNASAGAWTAFTLATDLRLPLSVDGFPQDYYFVYDRSIGFKPKNNKASCGCGEQERYQKQFIDVYGIELNDTNALTTSVQNSFAGGLVMSTEVRCDSKEFVCREFDANDAVSITLAYAVSYKAAELLIEEVLRSPEVNRFTMMNREYLWGKRNHFRKEYEDRIKYVSNIIDPSASDCFVCKTKDLMYGGIVS